MRPTICILAAALLAGCASQPQAPADGATAVPAPAATMAANDASSAAAMNEAFERAAKRYQMTEKDGQTVYCRKEAPLGSRLPTTVCLTEEQLQEEVRRVQEVRDGMSLGRAGNRCPSEGNC